MAVEHPSRLNCGAVVTITDDPIAATAETHAVSRIFIDLATGVLTIVPQNSCNEPWVSSLNTRRDQEWKYAGSVIVGNEQWVQFACTDVTGSPRTTPSPDEAHFHVFDLDSGDSIGVIPVEIIQD